LQNLCSEWGLSACGRLVRGPAVDWCGCAGRQVAEHGGTSYLRARAVEQAAAAAEAAKHLTEQLAARDAVRGRGARATRQPSDHCATAQHSSNAA
jgi:hypothetical protein